MALPFLVHSLDSDAWFSVGLASSFPNITESESVILSKELPCDGEAIRRGCRVFATTHAGGETSKAVQISDDPKDQVDASLRRGEQVLVFQYRGKFHAIDNVHDVSPPRLGLMHRY